jgi:glycosyltransferase involved in cell wall biosynthesis
MSSLSAIIITKNEETDLPDCLSSLSLARELVIVDSGSTDKTRSIAEKAGATFISFSDWPGFGAQKQRALDLATGDWILSIDADERKTPALEISIRKIIESTSAQANNGFEIQRHNYFLGKHLRFGGWGNDFVVRLAKRAHCRFDGAPVHESLLIEGSIGRIEEPLIHLSYSSRAEIIEKRHRYALAGALKLHRAGKSCSGRSEAALRASWTCFKHGFLQLGLLDGPIGLYAAYCKASETFLKYCHLAKMGQS